MFRSPSGSRGASLLSALVFVALLAGTVIAIEGTGAPGSQYAAAASPTFNPLITLNPSTGQIEDHSLPPAGAEKQLCQPGDQYVVTAGQPGQPTTKKVEDKGNFCKGTTDDAQKQCLAQHPNCEVTFCEPNGTNCHKMVFPPGDSAFQKATTADSPKDLVQKLSKDELARVFLSMTKEQRADLLPALGIDQSQTQGLLDAYATDLKTKADAAQETLDGLVRACGETSPNDGACTQKIPQMQADLDKMNAQLAKLKDEGVSLQGQSCADAGANIYTCNPPTGYGSVGEWCNSAAGKSNPNCAGIVPGTDQPGVGDYCQKNPAACNTGSLPGGCPLGQPKVDGKCPEICMSAGGTGCGPATQPHTCPNGGTWPTCTDTSELERLLKQQQQSPLQKMLGDLSKMFGGGAGSGSGSGSGSASPPQQPAQPCSTDPNIYAQQQQQYQTALQQYNYQLQQYNYQRQLNSYYGGNAPTPPTPAQPSACQPSTTQQCQSQPQQPAASSCSGGIWQPNYSGVCITNWQCINGNGSGNPSAQLSCQPQVADVGQTLAVAYSCSSGTATGSGFDASGGQSGTATTTVANPPAGTNTASYTLTCNDQGKTAGAQCSIQVNKSSIILVANPKTVKSGENSLIGWITSGMQSCVVSSPTQSDFTDRNAPNTSPNGTATTSPITGTSTFLLHCQTLSGGVKDASTTISIK